MQYEDLKIKCRTCENDFTWPAGEQKFFAEKGMHPPKDCAVCRRIKKLKLQGQ